MALKNGMFESYVKERETPVGSTKTPDNSKYSHNRVFDEPESLKNTLITEDTLIDPNSKKGNLDLVTKKKLVSNQLVTNKESISNQLVTTQDLVAKISGLQRKILFYIVDDCIYRGKLVSGFITNETLREITGANSNTVKTATQRLINKGLIRREQGKRGKSGFSSFVIAESIRDAVLKEKRRPSISNQLVTN